MLAKIYQWLLNPLGREVEVPNDQVGKLLKQGFRKIDKPTGSAPKKLLNLSAPQRQYPYGGYGRIYELLTKKVDFNHGADNVLHIGYPVPFHRDINKKYFLFTCFESDRIPSTWPMLCANYDVIIVPSRFCKETFIAGGVTTPIETMILGTDFDSPIETYPDVPFVFLHYNAFSDFKRKGWDLVVKAFLSVFGRYDKTQLILKGRQHDNENDIKEIPKRANITVIIQNMNRIELASLQEKVHCMVFPSRGEGLGLPPLETMARGLPTIVSKNTGMMEFADFGVRLNNFTKVPATYQGLPFTEDPHWFEVEQKELEDKMFYVYRNYEKVKKQALANAKVISKIFSLDNTVDSFIKIYQKYAISP